MSALRRISWVRISLLTTALCVLASAATAQTIARTSDGKPDLQGMWLNGTATPLERLKDWADKVTLSDEEARAYEQRYQLDRTAALTRDTAEFELAAAGDLDTYEPGKLLPGNRTSLITDPPDGRVPALTPEAQRRVRDQGERLNRHFAEGPENFTAAERCLVVGNASVPPMLPVFYNNNVQIVQTRDYVMILSEMVHDTRIIALNGRAHLPAGVEQWKGDSVGRWDGDTLVVDTTNFTNKTLFRGSGSTLHVVERFTLSSANTLKYQFTIDDPSSFVRSWSAESLLSKTDGRMYEYACHEANDSLTNTMRGARFMENEEGTQKPQSTPQK